MRGEVFWGIVEKCWVLNAWCDILKKMSGIVEDVLEALLDLN